VASACQSQRSPKHVHSGGTQHGKHTRTMCACYCGHSASAERMWLCAGELCSAHAVKHCQVLLDTHLA